MRWSRNSEKIENNFGRNEAPSAPGVRKLLRKVRETGMLRDNRSHPRARPVRTAEIIAAVAQNPSHIVFGYGHK
ncbi:hypothetical protein NQ318_001518 [Aromia moschata]|uniref:Uncharacterized protein n=1 Tax=Aromia moschata TaxID=1265417 RepID=A0AAV8Y7S7_9CUCU|nr:hypothetical protein NQ318_001518 [Aromia moschata]